MRFHQVFDVSIVNRLTACLHSRCFPGHIPAQLASCGAEPNCSMSRPISAIKFAAATSSIPGMVVGGLTVDHVTFWRWVQRYAPILNQRLRRERRHPNRSWRVDETYVRVAGDWVYLYHALDSAGDMIDFI
jgi:hypothetical protein